MNDNYDDIINLPHHVSKVHPQMSMLARAAQFAPFAALTGHGAAIAETARLTDDERELGEENTTILNRKMALLKSRLHEHPSVCITFFMPDERKTGGSYQTTSGYINKIDDYEQTILMSNGILIPIQHIFDIDGALFDEL